MTNQEIIDNAPEGATHVDNNGYYLKASKSGFMEPSDCGIDWDYDYANHTEVRSLADIARIVELEKERDALRVECYELGQYNDALETNRPIRDLEQQAKGVEDSVEWLVTNYPNECNPCAGLLSYFKVGLGNQAKALRGKANDF